MDEQKPRQLPRFDTKRKVKVLMPDAEDIDSCVIEDLHLKGMRVSFSKQLPQEKPVKMSFTVSDYYDPIKIEAKILWEKEDQGRYIYGLEFIKIADPDKERIYKYLATVHYDQYKDKWWK